MKKRLICILYAASLMAIILNACQSEEELTYGRYYVNGKGVYETHCENCHGKEGQGLAELIPALTDTTYLKQNRNRLACFIRYGLTDKIIVNKTTYQGKMPADAHLMDIDVAQVITYITNSFGNRQGIYDVDEVAKDLKDCK